MRDFISSHYQNKNEDRFNIGLLDRTYDAPLHEYIADSCRSLEVLENIKFLGYEFIEDATKINMTDYQFSRQSPTQEKPKLIDMKDSRVAELRARFRIELGDESETIVKKFLVPVADDDGYYLLSGSRYMMQYQLVDSSTYTRASELIHKSSMPVSIDTDPKEYTDMDGFVYRAPIYTVLLFKSQVNALHFYLAKFGLTQTLSYFNVDSIINLAPLGNENPDAICFDATKRIQVEVNRKFFNKYQYVQSIAFMVIAILKSSGKKLSLDEIDDREYWTTELGNIRKSTSYNEYARGLSTLTLFERMVDESSKKSIKLHKANKRDIYSTVRWLIQNYKELRKKDNMDLANKRLRCNEYIAALLTEEFSKRLTRIISGGNRAKSIKKIKEIFSVPGNIILQQLHKSGILRFDDRINDMDFFSKLRYTQKGPNSLGRTNTKTISTKHKGIHPSYVGLIDINVCGTSDPGSSGVLTPFAKTHGLYFDASNEPEDGVFPLMQEKAEYYRNHSNNEMYIDIEGDCESISDVRDIEYKLSEVKDKFKVYKTPLVIVEEQPKEETEET